MSSPGKAGPVLDCAGRVLDLSRPQVMGILNATPDSFSDGGFYLSADAALRHAWEMVQEGAAIIDVGGESTRPGAEPVSAAEEIKRVVPVIEALHREIAVPISIDTRKPEVMRAAVAAGAGMINDVTALRAPGALDAARNLGVPVCLMHMRGEPRTMQRAPSYADVVGEVKAFLAQRLEACEAAGIPRERLVVDPGFGFGKTVSHNLQLLKHLGSLLALGVPVLAGLSRKSMISVLLGVQASERMLGSVTLAALAVWQGAAIVRVHDVAVTVQAVRLCQAIKQVE